jgi:preprotein translocase subunit SecA
VSDAVLTAGYGRRRPRAPAKADVDSALTWGLAAGSTALTGFRSRKAQEAGDAASLRLAELAALDAAALRERLRIVRAAMRREGLAPPLVVEALALAGEACRRTLNLTPFSGQFACASALVGGAVAEMDTGEGKTLAAYLAASAFALAGRLVHVVTANDYLASRDAQELRPAYEALGLSVGIVVNGDEADKRRAAYACDIVYVSSKEVVFDFLRDGLARDASAGDPHLARTIDRALGGRARARGRALQRGLDVAIVDEADSVLIDEAATPLLISTEGAQEISPADARRALELAGDFRPGVDFVVDAFEYMPTLTARGLERLETELRDLAGPWGVRLVREEMMAAAIAARHVMQRDRHYLVRGDRIVLIDQQSGRVTPDRHWGHGLSLMVEIKEGRTPTGVKQPLASISFQRYFRGYTQVCGMSGTVAEVAREMRAVYGLNAVRIRRRLPLRRKVGRAQVFAERARLWESVVRRARDLQARGQPALVAVRSVGEAARASAALDAAGVAHRVLSAAQDGAEAEIVARAGERGAITVVTNMAGRGTDIKLGDGVAELGGLAVLICERHDSRRVDRQLIGRCARQGDPGLVVEFVTREDSVLACLSPRWRSALALFPRLTRIAISRAQKIGDARGVRARVQLLRRDEQLTKTMAFAGGLD